MTPSCLVTFLNKVQWTTKIVLNNLFIMSEPKLKIMRKLTRENRVLKPKKKKNKAWK
jgi:hypothetical protein